MKSIINKINYDYDRENDVLYYTFSSNKNSYGDEDPDNIVFMRDIDTDELTGITILNFLTMYRKKDTRIERISKYINIEVVIKNII